VAVETTDFIADFTRVPFVTPPDWVRAQTALPRARVDFVVSAGVVPVKALNDDQLNRVANDLPTTFAYRLLSAQCSIEQDSANSYAAFAEMEITNAVRGQPLGHAVRHPMPSGETFNSDILAERIWFMDPLQGMPTYIIQSLRANVAPTITFNFVNGINPASGAGLLNFYASYYEYDIEQVQLYPALTPSALTYVLG
jgi:hypothetical protein